MGKKHCDGCGRSDCKNEGGWNYRVVGQYHPSFDTWTFSIRDVYYDKNKTNAYGAEPQCPMGENLTDLKLDFELMHFATHKPILVIDLESEKLIQPHVFEAKYGKKIPYFFPKEEEEQAAKQ